MAHSSADDTISIQDAGGRLQAPPAVLHALARSGLLGFWRDGRVPLSSVIELERFGTQWSAESSPRQLPPDTIHTVGDPPGTPGGIQAADTFTQIQIAPDALETADNDTGWIAQYYVRPNRFFFPSPTALALVGPVLLRLPARRQVAGTKLPVTLFPGPDGAFAMLQVIGAGKPADTAFEASYDVASPILDELAFEYDVPLPVCQTVVIGVPSGTISMQFPRPPRSRDVQHHDQLRAGCPYPELVEATALYKDGISSDNVFHRFFSLYKSYESSCKARGDWRKKLRQKTLTLVDEVLPADFAFRPHEGVTFDQARQRLNKSLRIALAHGEVRGGTPATVAEYNVVAGELAVVRYMAYTTLKNVRATYATSDAR